MDKPWRGIFTIPQTPFHPDGTLDEEGLRKEVEFCIACGAHGIVAPVNASEFYTLSDAERERVIHVIIEQTQARIPVIIGVTATVKELAVQYSRQAEEASANGVIAMPPYVFKAKADGVTAYYKAISDAIHIPVMIQNAPPPLGSSLSPALMVQLCRELENIQYIKEETLPTGHYITAINKTNEPAVKGVFGGAAARWMIHELDRGVCGFMPACHFTDVYVHIWDLYEAGECEEARQVYYKFLPLINMELILSVSLAKYCLVKRGVFEHEYARRPDGVVLDEFDRKEIDRTIEEIQPYLKVR